MTTFLVSLPFPTAQSCGGSLGNRLTLVFQWSLVNTATSWRASVSSMAWSGEVCWGMSEKLGTSKTENGNSKSIYFVWHWHQHQQGILHSGVLPMHLDVLKFYFWKMKCTFTLVLFWNWDIFRKSQVQVQVQDELLQASQAISNKPRYVFTEMAILRLSYILTAVVPVCFVLNFMLNRLSEYWINAAFV